MKPEERDLSTLKILLKSTIEEIEYVRRVNKKNLKVLANLNAKLKFVKERLDELC